MSVRERRQIVAQYGVSPQGALITLVRASGSTYRKPGARILADTEGNCAGTISGGCLEAGLLRKAAWKIREGAIVEHFSTAFDDTAEVPYGLGCGGEVDVLLEPASAPEAEALLNAMRNSLQGETSLIATVLPEEGSGLGRIIVNERGDVVFASEWIATEDVVDLRAFLRRQLHATEESTLTHRNIFLERIAPPQRLILFGAGEGTRPLVALSAQLGWTTIVADRRSQHVHAERFPLADAVITYTDSSALDISHKDAVVLMTHSYDEDRRLLSALLVRKPRYLGLLGARHRSSLLLTEAASTTGLTLAEACARVHAPVGFDLGGDGPEAIALAILSEIQATLHHRTATPRGMTEDEVKAQIAQHGSASPISACALDHAE